MFLLEGSETTVGLSLSILGWDFFPVQKLNMFTFLDNTFLSLNPKRMINMHKFCR